MKYSLLRGSFLLHSCFGLSFFPRRARCSPARNSAPGCAIPCRVEQFVRRSLGIPMPLRRLNLLFFLMPSCCELDRRSTEYALRFPRYSQTVTVHTSPQPEVRI